MGEGEEGRGDLLGLWLDEWNGMERLLWDCNWHGS